MRFADFYKAGAVMGFSPRDVDAFSLWQFQAAIAGWNEAHGGSRGLTADEFRELSDMIDQTGR